MANLKDITKFLEEVSAIRAFDLKTSFIATPDAKRLRDEELKDSVTELLEIYPDLESPEREYLESMKNFYGLSQKNNWDYSAIEKGRTSLDAPITELDFTVRALNALEGAEIDYLGTLLKYSDKDLFKFRKFGNKTVEDVKEGVSKLGYRLGMKKINYVRPEDRK